MPSKIRPWSIRPPAPLRERLAAYLERTGQVRNAFITEAITEKLERDMYEDGGRLNEDLKARADEAVMQMLAGHGVDITRVAPREDGTFGMQYADGTRIEFGESVLDGDGNPTEPNGWDWTEYGTDGEAGRQDWAPDNETLIGVLKSLPEA
jgi:predicted DNA-binding protein